MNKALLPILARLHALQSPSRMSPEGGRIIASRLDPDPITVVLREANETVLGRSLQFTRDDGVRFSINVAGRRILKVAEAIGLVGSETCLAAPVLEDEHKDDLIKLLKEFAAPRHEIRLLSVPVSEGSDGLSVGLPVALLADLLLIELNGFDSVVVSDAGVEPLSPAPSPTVPAAEDGSAIGRFARANGTVLMAWLILGGEEDGATSGLDEMVDHLKSFLQDEMADLGAQLDRLSQAPGEPICLALGASLIEGHSILCARIEGAILLGLAEGDMTQSLSKAWTSVFP